MINFKNAVLNNRKGVKYFTFPLLENSGLVNHGFSTREGGVSEGIYATMNLSLKLDDDSDNVLKNINIFSEAIGINPDSIVMSNQTHSAKVRCIDETDVGTGITKPSYTDDVDGLITDVPQITLMTFYADCVPVYFLDVKRKVIALSHSGWKGTYDRITKVTIETMAEKYGSEPENIVVVTGPSICKKCYEVSVELGEKFLAEFNDCAHAIEFVDGKCYLDLNEIIRSTALSCGIKEKNIAVSGVCTCCNSELLHSHRATGGKRGLNAAMMSLKG